MLTDLETQRLENLIKTCRGHVYSEPDTDLHTSLIDQIVPSIFKDFMDKSMRILDIGCGSGYAMEKFRDLGVKDLVGLTLSSEDAEAARARGFSIVEEDMSFTTLADRSFDFLWVRHAVEHSPFPFLTLMEFYRLLRPGGRIYIEVPSPEGTRDLESYDNHYSIMGRRQWYHLLIRSGFRVLRSDTLAFDYYLKDNPNVPAGKEVYDRFIAERPAN